jgi:SAM-dependent methyltransferase
MPESKSNNILFISHKKKKCGVYEFGKNISDSLQKSQKYNFIYQECASLKELDVVIKQYCPIAIIYNYYPSTMPWVTTKILPRMYRNNLTSITIPQIGIVHEITQTFADRAINYKNKFTFLRPPYNSIFDFYIAADPTLLLKNPLVYKTGRLIKYYENKQTLPTIPTIGSFGFATPNKGFEDIIPLVQKEFDEAIIRINIPLADFGDAAGIAARQIENNCRELITKPNIKLEITHEFFENEKVFDFLAANSINIFLYKDTGARGISSVTDYALAVKRPIAVSKNSMFRHVLNFKPSVCVEDNPLKTIIENGVSPLNQTRENWSEENLIWEYERIMDSILKIKSQKPTAKTSLKTKIKFKIKKTLSLPNIEHTWLINSEKVDEDDLKNISHTPYEPVILPKNFSFNRILNDKARKIYQPAIIKLWELMPKTMAKKIPAANVQQAFVFDTVLRNIPNYSKPKILCVGSYEDTASMSLKKMGIDLEEVDPMLNYTLEEYATKPTTIPKSYDIIFSTSVIEHDPDDKAFMQALDKLLAPGGIIIMTCDYQENWTPEKPKPNVDARLYTQYDLRNRLLSYLENCRLIDTPNWNCPNPDFNFLGKYQYAFASFVAKKHL